MVDLTRSTVLLVLALFFLTVPPPLLSDDGIPDIPPKDTSCQQAVTPEDCAAGTGSTAASGVINDPRPVPATSSVGEQTSPAPESADAPSAPVGTIPASVPLPPLSPVAPSPPLQTPLDLAPQDPSGVSQAILPPADTVAKGSEAGASAGPPGAHNAESRLHEGLSWDYCGPRPGSPNLGGTETADTSRIPVDIAADRVDYDRNTEIIQLQGDVEILQRTQRLEAERASYARRTGQMHATEQVFLEYQGMRVTGDDAEYNLLTKQGRIDRARYRMSANANLRGTAEEARILSETLSRYRNITYTTCPPGRLDWSIKAKDLELDQATGLGTARHARLRIADVPIFYTPYLQFPIDSRRRSGFLIPTFGSSDTTGTDITIPYYWNIAPNLDATLIPRYMSTRGLMLGAQVRYLNRFQEIELNTEILPHDLKDETQGERGALRIEQSGHLGGRWATSVDYAAVSDDQYLEDFGNRLDVTSIRNLTQRGDLSYTGDGWNLLTRLQEFQTVDPTITSANRPYGQLPHIELDVDPQRWNDLVEYRFDGQYDYFDHNTNVHGNRLVTVPSVRLPMRRAFGYLIPRARLYYTGYDLVDQADGLPARQSYLIPSFDVDGKLIFERATRWWGSDALQTLEPRLYYVFTPFEDQSEAPLFDTTALDFSFASLFRPNRFTGYDRIGDENRVTLGLTSRTIANRTGQELFRASIGQVYYLDNQQVQLDGNTPEADDSSSVAGEFAVRLHEDWSARASVQWNPHETEEPWEKRVLQLGYAPGDGRLINLAYRFNFGDQEAERYEDTDLSFQLPLGSRVKLVGRWLYSLLNEETIEAFAGIEFGRCCWRLRLLGQHLKTSADATGSTSVMLQLELAGLGSFGNQIDKLLERGIYGYHTD